LGLALSKRLAELLSGTVTVHSELGLGSTVSAIIPVHFAPNRPPSAEEIKVAAGSKD